MLKKNLWNKNSIPFFLLIVTHMVLLFFLVIRKKQKNIWFVLLANMGLAYLFEYVVLNIFQGYRYKPSILKNRHLDKLLGAILSQGLYVPVSATFQTFLKLKWYWKIGFSLFYYIIEKMFIRLGVYQVRWWRPIYTFHLLILYFYISDWLYSAFASKKRWAILLVHYLSVEVIDVTVLFYCAVKRYIRFGRGIFHSWKEHFIIVPLYSMALSFLTVKNSVRTGLTNRLLLVVCYLFIDLFLSYMGILKIKLRNLPSMIKKYVFMATISRFFYIKIFDK
ncbi:hypothetical protein RZN22_15860 [Bacillaceae bacterium S4-13-58]